MQVTEIAFSVYPVTDLKRARAFYEGMLGLKPGMVYEGEGAGYIEYEIGPGVVAIGAGSLQLKTSVALEVADFDQQADALGVEILVGDGQRGAAQQPAAFAFDRENVTVAVIQILKSQTKGFCCKPSITRLIGIDHGTLHGPRD